MENNPLVSVIIPTYKRSDYLIRAIESVLNQTYQPIEIIVVDDNDGDNQYRLDTQNNLEPYIRENKIRYIKHEKNKGLPAARNTGCKASFGEYIAFLDDDDEFLPNKTALQVACFQKSDSIIGLVYGSFIRFETETNQESIIYPKHKGNLEKVLGLNHIGPPSMVMCTREAFEIVNGFDESFRSREDIDFYYRLAKHFEIEFIEDVVMKYYIHNNTMSKIHQDKLTYFIRFLDKYNKELKKPSSRWSELQDRLGELYAVNGQMLPAWGAFLKAFGANPGRLKVLVKALLTLGGKDFYKKMRKVS